MANQKTRFIGKTVIIFLCIAILFFLLLPFLDGTAASASGRKSAPAKAIPQIFTSNPLGELTQKILQAMGYRYRHPTEKEILAFSKRQGMAPTVASTEPVAFAARHANENTDTYTFDPNQPADSPNAAFMNEEGEWLLVNQTAPANSSRGMHDINLSDSPYDRLLRLERQAKYTRPAAAAATAPTSKWARLWNPVKKFFGFDDQEQHTPEILDVASAGGESTYYSNPQLLAAASPRTDWNEFIYSGNLSDEEYAKQVRIFLDPAEGARETMEAMKEIAKKHLSPKEYKNWKDKTRPSLQEILNAAQENLEKDAAGMESEFMVDSTFKCNEKKENERTVPLYYNMCGGTDDSDLPSRRKLSRLQEDAQTAKEQSVQILNQKMRELTGGALSYQKPFEMMVVLQEITPDKAAETPIAAMLQNMEGIEPDSRKQEEHQMYLEFFKDYYGHLYEQQCGGSQSCYLVGGENLPDPTLQLSIESGGFDYLGDPNHVHEQTFNTFKQEYVQKLQNTDPEKAEQFQKLLEKRNAETRQNQYVPYYIYYSGEKLKEIMTPHSTTDMPKYAYVPTAANATDVSKVIPATNLVWDKPGEDVFSAENNANTNELRGAHIRSQVIEKWKRAQALHRQFTADVSTPTVEGTIRTEFSKPSNNNSPNFLSK